MSVGCGIGRDNIQSDGLLIIAPEFTVHKTKKKKKKTQKKHTKKKKKSIFAFLSYLHTETVYK